MGQREASGGRKLVCDEVVAAHGHFEEPNAETEPLRVALFALWAHPAILDVGATNGKGDRTARILAKHSSVCGTKARTRTLRKGEMYLQASLHNSIPWIKCQSTSSSLDDDTVERFGA